MLNLTTSTTRDGAQVISTLGPNEYDYLGKMHDFESGNLSEKETITLVQQLIDSGIVWLLNDHYAALANKLLENGFCHITRLMD